MQIENRGASVRRESTRGASVLGAGHRGRRKCLGGAPPRAARAAKAATLCPRLSCGCPYRAKTRCCENPVFSPGGANCLQTLAFLHGDLPPNTCTATFRLRPRPPFTEPLSLSSEVGFDKAKYPTGAPTDQDQRKRNNATAVLGLVADSVGGLPRLESQQAAQSEVLVQGECS